MKLTSINWVIRINSFEYENLFAQFIVAQKTILVDVNLQPYSFEITTVFAGV